MMLRVFFVDLFYFREMNLIELPKTLVQPRIHKTNTSPEKYLQHTKELPMCPHEMPSIAHYFPLNAHTPAVNTLQGHTTTSAKAVVAADSDNSSTAAVCHAVVGVVGTLGVDN